MRICDRCGEPAIDQVILEQDDTRYDVCDQCKYAVIEVVASKPKKKRPTLRLKRKQNSHDAV